MPSQPELPHLTPGATILCRGPELHHIMAELNRLGLRAATMDAKKPSCYRLTIAANTFPSASATLKTGFMSSPGACAADGDHMKDNQPCPS